MHFPLLLTFIPLLSHLVAAQGYGYGYGGGDGGSSGGEGGSDDGTSAAASPTTSASTSVSTSTTSSAGSLLTGDSVCSGTMCIAATVNGSETTYVLSSRGSAKFGWMAMGFGGQMANTPMVIMWINNGKLILSQRKAPSEVMPTTDPNPPRVATALLAQSSLTTANPSLAFTVPTSTNGTQSIIYAFGTTDPGVSDPNTSLVQHLDSGPLTLNLTKPITSTSGNNTGSADGSVPAFSRPLLPYEKLIVAHAILCTVGFLFLLPAGVLLARYMRTFISTWFKGHWIIQFGIAGLAIIIGMSLGIAAVSQAKADHLDDDHKRWGIALVVLYFVQCGLGAFIHFVKKADRKHRPAQNYLHAVLGLAIIGLSLYQVHSGFDFEWVHTTGRDPLPSSVKIVFWIWVAVLPASYAIGLSFLPKQFRQERAQVKNPADVGNW